MPTIPTLFITFPHPSASNHEVKTWVNNSLIFRGQDPPTWVHQIIWVGRDLYTMSTENMENNLISWGASSPTADAVTRDILGAKDFKVSSPPLNLRGRAGLNSEFKIQVEIYTNEESNRVRNCGTTSLWVFRVLWVCLCLCLVANEFRDCR